MPVMLPVVTALCGLTSGWAIRRITSVSQSPADSKHCGYDRVDHGWHLAMSVLMVAMAWWSLPGWWSNASTVLFLIAAAWYGWAPAGPRRIRIIGSYHGFMMLAMSLMSLAMADAASRADSPHHGDHDVAHHETTGWLAAGLSVTAVAAAAAATAWLFAAWRWRAHRGIGHGWRDALYESAMAASMALMCAAH